MSETNFSSKNSDELNIENNKIIECDDDDKIKKTYETINIHSFMDTASTLFQKVISDDYSDDSDSKKKSTELIGNLIKWDICVDDNKIDLAVSTISNHNTEWNLIIRRTDNYYCPYKFVLSNGFYNDHEIIASSLFNNNDVVILTTFVPEFVRKDNMNILQYYKKIFSKSTLPLPNSDSFRVDGWVSVIKNNKSSFLNYGVELLAFAIKEHNGSIIFGIFLI
ncbi:hypothetical protein GLOIN_2v1767996 [Rhizophagus irregularis DAOM 181602=DAOM 197198]|nr:hypothetical protein GLOIN_2v1767996 [Rhizophagus irregularis DAOM 181602=DAOM 197198]